MDENPYQSPLAEASPVSMNLPSDRREELRSIAVWQKGVLVCILVQLVAILAQYGFAAGSWPRFIVGVCQLGSGLEGAIFVVGLATKVYHSVLGVVLGVFALFPCIGLLVLLAVNERATKALQGNGYRVGLLGADLSQFREVSPERSSRSDRLRSR